LRFAAMFAYRPGFAIFLGMGNTFRLT
jgi:hypothetical protein